MFLRIIVVALLALVNLNALAAEAKCVVAKKTLISVVLLEKSNDKPGMRTRESISVFLNGRPPLSFRIGEVSGTPWRIPSECKAAMEKVLSAEEISKVSEATQGK